MQQILGIGTQNITWYQAVLRTVIVYIATIAMVRIGEKRFLGKHTAFDVIVGFILGSMISSAINSPCRSGLRCSPVLCWWGCTGCLLS